MDAWGNACSYLSVTSGAKLATIEEPSPWRVLASCTEVGTRVLTHTAPLAAETAILRRKVNARGELPKSFAAMWGIRFP